MGRAAQRRRPGRARRGAARRVGARSVSAREGDRHPARAPRRSRSSGGIEALGHEVVECPLIEIVRTSDEPIDCAGYEWAVVTSPNGADEVARRARNLPEGRGGRARARPRRCAATGSSRPSSPSVSTAGRTAGRVPAARGQGALPRGRELAARPDRRARAPTSSPLYSTVLLSPEPPEGDVVVLASGSAARAYAWIGGAAPAVSIGPETTPRRRLGRARRSRSRPTTPRPRRRSSRPSRDVRGAVR